MSEQFPQQFRHLAAKRDSRTSSQSRRKGEWALDIAGPFCLWPRRNMPHNRQAEQIADMVSAALCLPVRSRILDGALYVTIPAAIPAAMTRGAGA
jgi:hypothetical protein